jgi:hypothetical protein
MRGLHSLLKTSDQAPRGLKPSKEETPYRSAESAATPKSEFFSKLSDRSAAAQQIDNYHYQDYDQ